MVQTGRLVVLLAAVMVGLTEAEADAQVVDPDPRGGTAVYVDLLGPGLLYSVGFEHLGGPRGQYGARVGISTFEIDFLTENRAYIIPISLLYVRRGRVAGIEVGGGPIISAVTTKGDGEFGDGGIVGHVLLGGRFNDRPGARVIIRLTGMLAFNGNGVLPWPGLGFNFRL